MVVASEIAVDIVKHAFITKFNDITADVGIVFGMLNAILSLLCYFFNIKIDSSTENVTIAISIRWYNLGKFGNVLIFKSSSEVFCVQETHLLLK